MSSYRVLVVDDNHEIRRMVTASIKTLGTEIDVLDVPSAEEALFISASLPLDLVVLDYRLPGMSGLEMVTLLRKRKPAIKIILVTGVEDAKIRQQVSEANVAAYFFKPIEVDAFLKAVQQCLWPDLEKVSLPVPSPIINEVIATRAKEPAALPSFEPSLGERLSALKQQVRAESVVLVSEVGQILERTGGAEEITANFSLLPALMDAFRASQRVSDAFGKQASESLFFFTQSRQHIFLAPVDPSYVLLVLTTGYIEPDKLGMIDRAIHLAANDLQALLENTPETLLQDTNEPHQVELPAEVVIDQETLAGVADMFSRVSPEEIKQEADGFWESLREKGALDGKSRKDTLSYDEARDMGLAPDEGQGP